MVLVSKQALIIYSMHLSCRMQNEFFHTHHSILVNFIRKATHENSNQIYINAEA